MSDNTNSTNCPCPCPPWPPYPPYPPVPPTPPVPVEIKYKDIILTKMLDGVLYELMVMTSSNNVYLDPDKKVTLTEKLSTIADDLLSLNTKSDTLENKFSDLLKDAPETFNTFKKVWDYVNVDGDPQSALIKMIKSKQDAEAGKGLSTHDLTDVLYEKLVNDYTKAELDEKFSIVFQREEQNKAVLVKSIEDLDTKVSDQIETLSEKVEEIEDTPAIQVSDTEPEGIKDYTVWYQVIQTS